MPKFGSQIGKKFFKITFGTTIQALLKLIKCCKKILKSLIYLCQKSNRCGSYKKVINKVIFQEKKCLRVKNIESKMVYYTIYLVSSKWHDIQTYLELIECRVTFPKHVLFSFEKTRWVLKVVQHKINLIKYLKVLKQLHYSIF